MVCTWSMERPDGSGGSATRGWVVSAAPGADIPIELLDEAIAGSPLDLSDSGELLPRRRGDATVCRICGSEPGNSREHVPPRSAGNSGRFTEHTFDEWSERGSLGHVPGGRTRQGGVFGYVLCESCNNTTGRFATAYKRLAAAAAKLFVDEMEPIEEMNARLVSPLVTVRFDDCAYADFGRQAASIACVVAGPWMLTDRYPQLRKVLLEDAVMENPSDLSIRLGLCAPVAGLTAGPSVHVDLENEAWRWIAVAAHPPFAFEVELAVSENWVESSPLCDITNSLSLAEKSKGNLELTAPVVFANTMFPGDWRTLAQVEGGLDVYGRRSRE